MVKYYAVKSQNGNKVFVDWVQTQDFIKNNKKVTFKSFSNFDDAVSFLNDTLHSEINIVIKNNQALIFTDGSFDNKTNRYSYASIILLNDSVYELYGSEIEYLEFQNIAGEVMAVIYSLHFLHSIGISEVIINHDYIGIRAWAINSWKAKSKIAEYYKSIIDYYFNKINISFNHIFGHTNNKYNLMADALTKLGYNFDSPQIVKRKPTGSL